MATKIKSGDATIILRTPGEKALRYGRQMKAGKVRETGKELTAVDKAWRAGYISAMHDQAQAFKSKHKNYQRKTK